jgi:hypothetical protein
MTSAAAGLDFLGVIASSMLRDLRGVAQPPGVSRSSLTCAVCQTAVPALLAVEGMALIGAAVKGGPGDTELRRGLG